MLKNISPEKRRLSFILVTMFLNFLGFSIVIPIMPFLVEKFAIHPGHLAVYIGLLFSTYAVCQFLAAPGLGALSDLWGRRPILLICLFGSVIGYLFLGFATSLWMLFLGRIIDGLTGGNISTVYAYLADIIDPRHRSKYYGMVGAAGAAGFMLGPAIGGVLGSAHLTAPLFLAAGISLLNMIWGYFVLPESLKTEHRAHHFDFRHLNPFSHLFKFLSVDIIRRLFLTSFIYFLSFSTIYSITSVYTKEVLFWGTAQIGAMLFFVSLVDIFAQGYLLRRLIPLWGEVKTGFIGMILCILGIALVLPTAFNASLVLFYIGFTVFNFGDGLLEPSVNGLIANSVGPRQQGRVQGANLGIQSLTRVFGPLLAAGLYTFKPFFPYAGSLILFIISLAVFFSSIKVIKAHHVAHAFPGE
jgi:MFS transporter, DHA1 family, tetracycline resistance protein